jgi:hypothetical protein
VLQLSLTSLNQLQHSDIVSDVERQRTQKQLHLLHVISWRRLGANFALHFRHSLYDNNVASSAYERTNARTTKLLRRALAAQRDRKTACTRCDVASTNDRSLYANTKHVSQNVRFHDRSSIIGSTVDFGAAKRRGRQRARIERRHITCASKFRIIQSRERKKRYLTCR